MGGLSATNIQFFCVTGTQSSFFIRIENIVGFVQVGVVIWSIRVYTTKRGYLYKSKASKKSQEFVDERIWPS